MEGQKRVYKRKDTLSGPRRNQLHLRLLLLVDLLLVITKQIQGQKIQLSELNFSFTTSHL